MVTFSEVPDEISLCIEISNCPCHCKGCHSAYLAEDIGEELTEDELIKLIEKHRGITCVSFMGGDSEPHEVLHLARLIKIKYPVLKVGWYSGRENLPWCINLNINNFDFIKLGPYIEEKGPLNSKTTNQKMYEVVKNYKTGYFETRDITYKFQKDEDKD